MALGVKYSKQFQNLGVNTTYRVDILSEVGGSVITPWKMGANPLQLRSLGAEKDEDKIVIGSEISFEFILQKHLNESDYDALFESEYKEMIVKFYNDDTSDLLWQGYLQPEDMSKSLFESNLHIYLTASDALKDLSDYSFLNSGAIVSGDLTGLEIIKLCLTNLGFEYNFIVKLGTKPDRMTTDNHTALKYVTHDTSRFSTVEDGKTVVDDCLTVIEKVLDPYSCTLSQYGGEYYIKEKYEENTYYYTYGWDLVLIGNRAVSNDVVDIDSLKYRRSADASMLSPYKEMGLTLLNRNPGDELVSDINLFSAGPWEISPAYGGFPAGDLLDEDPNLHAKLRDTNEIGDGYTRSIKLINDFTLNKITENDYIKFSFQIKTDSVEYNPPRFKITVSKPDGDYETWIEDTTLNTWVIYESPNNETFRVNADGDYNITITLYESITATPTYLENVYLTNFSLTKIVSIDDETFADVTFDTYYKAISDQGKKVKDDKEMYFGDTTGTGDVAALVYLGSNTDVWSREGKTESLSLLQIHALNYLTNRKSYSKYIIIDVKDRLDTITPVNYISFDGDTFDIVSFDKSYRSGWVSLHLKQRLTGDVTLDFQEVELTSIDGESTTTTTTVVETTGGTMVYPGSGIALSSGSDWSASIANNSDNWNTAFGWGDHASAGYAPTASPTFTGTVSADIITASGIITGKAFRSTNSSDLNLFIRSGGNNAAYIQQVDATGEIASFRYGSASAGGGTEVMAIDYDKVDITKPLNVIGTTGIVWGAGANSSGLLTIGTGGVTGGSCWINTPSLSASYHSGLGVSGSYGSQLSVVNLTAYGVHSGGGYSSSLILSTTSQRDIVNVIELDGKGNTKSPDFVTGWFGNNWQIAEAGDAEFENLIVRGSARFRELIIDQLAVLSGSQLLSVARGKVLSIDTVNSKVTLDDPNGTGACAFLVNDFFWIKNIDIDNGLFSDCRGQITNVTNTTLTLNFEVAGANGAITDITKGDVIVQRGHPTTASRQNMMYTTVSDTDAPFQRTMTGINSLAAFNDLDNVVLQTGNLESLDSHDIVPSSPGYGLYSDNVYLSGTIHAANGVIGGWTISNTALYKDTGTDATSSGMAPADYPFYAGKQYANRATASFRVTPAGALTAKGIAELGTESQLVNGYYQSIAIKGPDMWENSLNSQAGALCFNRVGYAGGTTQYRGAIFYDGKGNQVLHINGSATSSVRNYGDETIDGDCDIKGVCTIGGTIPNAYSLLDLQSTTKALRITRMTTTQRNLMSAVSGMIIYNTTDNQFQGYIGGSVDAWRVLN